MGKTVSTWPQFNSSPCSYQSYSVIARVDSILLGSALLQPQAVFAHTFDNIIKSIQRKVSQLDAASEAIHQRILLCNNLVLLLALSLRLSVITKISYSYYDITITYSICVQYSHATVDLILMAVDQQDIEYWKEPAVQIS